MLVLLLRSKGCRAFFATATLQLSRSSNINRYVVIVTYLGGTQTPIGVPQQVHHDAGHQSWEKHSPNISKDAPEYFHFIVHDEATQKCCEYQPAHVVMHLHTRHRQARVGCATVLATFSALFYKGQVIAPRKSVCGSYDDSTYCAWGFGTAVPLSGFA